MVDGTRVKKEEIFVTQKLLAENQSIRDYIFTYCNLIGNHEINRLR
jgi:hypothetical protein